MTCIYVVLWNVRRTWHEQRWNDAADSLGGTKQLGMRLNSIGPTFLGSAGPGRSSPAITLAGRIAYAPPSWRNKVAAAMDAGPTAKSV